MADLSQHDLPDTPYESKVCGLTVAVTLSFIAACAYYFLAPAKDGLALMIVMATGGLFAVALLNFFVAAFCGKICGQKKD